MSMPAPAVAHASSPSRISDEADRIETMTMPKITHTPSGLQDALRSSDKGSWKFVLLPLGFAAVAVIFMFIAAWR